MTCVLPLSSECIHIDELRIGFTGCLLLLHCLTGLHKQSFFRYSTKIRIYQHFGSHPVNVNERITSFQEN